MTDPIRTVVLVIRDGWGEPPLHDPRYDPAVDATALAHTPVDARLRASAPSTLLECSGLAVGLPEGQMGNSEVGHLNLGAGRIVHQDITRIDQAIRDGSFGRNQALAHLAESVGAAGGRVHLVGLCSDGGVHSHENHLHALIDVFADRDLPMVVHCIMDGRDTSPTSGWESVRKIRDHLAERSCGFIGTVVGRYYAMDRDRRWERTRVAYEAIVEREGPRGADPLEVIRASYAAGVTDEFILPVVIDAPGDDYGDYNGVEPRDGILFFNFRGDRARQITTAFVDPGFDVFPRQPHDPAGYLAMTQYEDSVPYPVVFPPQDLSMVLADVLAQAGLRQLRAAETEKYAHVTYFFNGGREEAVTLEDRCLVPSPKVATYDLQPEMSALALTDEVVRMSTETEYAFVLVNYANADMVGHTADIPATVKAVEVVDAGVGRLIDHFTARGGVLLVTADHGNAELLRDPDGHPFTAHTTNPVRLFLVGAEGAPALRRGILADVAPTVVHLLGLPQPPEMTGTSLLLGL